MTTRTPAPSPALPAPSPTEAAPPARATGARWSVPIGLFSIPLGLAGLGGAWTAAAQVLGASTAPATVAFAASTVVWIAFTLSYASHTLTSPDTSFGADLRHPLAGPLTAYLPVIAILLAAHYRPHLGTAAPWLVGLAVAALTVNIAQLLAHWLVAPLDHTALHPGYLLPMTAGPFIAAIGLLGAGSRDAAVTVFGVGVFFWLVVGTVIIGRLMLGAPLPGPFFPVLAVLVSPPGTAGVAWFAIQQGQIDSVQQVIGGITVILLLSQLVLLPDYLKLSFTTQHWAFTFPLAVLANVAIRWAHGLGFPGWQVAAWTVLAISTGSILLIIGATVRIPVRAVARARAARWA